MKTLYRSVLATLILAVILCGAYPLIVTGVAQALFHDQASGGILRDANGQAIGARLIGQSFGRSEYFHPRPSAAGDKGYDAANSSGSNLGPTNQKLADGVRANAQAFLKENPGVKAGEIPPDAVTASASGLDPEISPENARAQAARVAGARHADVAQVVKLVDDHVKGPQWGLFGEAAVNVLELNLELDRLLPVKK